jgi:hypothetical protein
MSLVIRWHEVSARFRAAILNRQQRQIAAEAARDARVIAGEQIAKAILEDGRVGQPRQVAGSEKVAAYWDGCTEQAIRDAEKARRIGRQKP